MQRLFGHHPTVIGSLLANILGRPDLAATLGAEAMARGLEEVSTGVVRIPGALDLVYELHGSRTLAVASNTPHHAVEQALKHTGMLDAFSFVVGSDDVAHPKPAPDIYVRACDLLDCPVASATAIEDSMPGVTSASGAGVYVIAISAEEVVRSAANESFISLLDPGLLARLTVS
jgi:HAD superfamily hydrolase (TIGR01509 family)